MIWRRGRVRYEGFPLSPVRTSTGPSWQLARLALNPLQHLLAPSRVLFSLPTSAQQTITGREFFPDLISRPFHQGLFLVFSVAAALSALASLLRGGRYVHPAAADELAPARIEPLRADEALPVSTAPPAEDSGRGEDGARADSNACAS